MSRVFELKKTSCNSPWLRLAPGGGGGDGAAGPVRVALAMAVVIVQTGAKKPGPGKKGVALPPGGVLISVTHLPNPYNKLDAFKREQGIADADWPSRKRDQVKQFLWHRAEPQLRRVLARAEKAIKRGQAVGIVCGFGRDRSPAVAELVAERAAGGHTVRLQHNDAESE